MARSSGCSELLLRASYQPRGSFAALARDPPQGCEARSSPQSQLYLARSSGCSEPLLRASYLVFGYGGLQLRKLPRDGYEARSSPQSRSATCQTAAAALSRCCVLPTWCLDMEDSRIDSYHASGVKHAAARKAGLLRAILSQPRAIPSQPRAIPSRLRAILSRLRDIQITSIPSP
jgi:hypothetical protein